LARVVSKSSVTYWRTRLDPPLPTWRCWVNSLGTAGTSAFTRAGRRKPKAVGVQVPPTFVPAGPTCAGSSAIVC